MGGNMKRVFINGRKVSLMAAELGNAPLEIDLDKLEENKDNLEKMKVDKQMLKELSQLETEEDMVRDIVKDFQSTGWRRVK